MALTESQIQELYVAYFGRPADVEGKAYWSGSSTGITTVEGFAANMHSQSEFQDAFGSKKAATQVNEIYQNLFSRDADATGLEYWTGQIANGTLQLAEIAVHLIWAAKNNTGGSADKTALENKVAAATAFTADVAADATAQLAYTADDATAFTTAKTFISGVSTTAATAAEIDTQVATIKTDYAGNGGSTINLTTAADTIVGTDKNDTINAVVDGDTTASETFTALDTIDGAKGVDTLRLVFNDDGVATATNSFPVASVSNVEVFDIKNLDVTSGTALTIDFATISGETTVTNNLSADDVIFNNLGSGTTGQVIGNGGSANTIASTFDYADAATSATVELKDGLDNGALSITGGKLTSVTIKSSGAQNDIDALTLAASATSLTIDASSKFATNGTHNLGKAAKLTITGSAAVDLNANALDIDVDTIDASAATGDIDVTAGNVAANTAASGATITDVADLKITTGSGNDEISFNSDANDEVDISAGAGNDTVTATRALVAATTTKVADVLDGGDGIDILYMATGSVNGHAAVTTVTNFEELSIGTAANANDVILKNIQATGFNTVNAVGGVIDGSDITFTTGSVGILNLQDASTSSQSHTVQMGGTGTSDEVQIINEDTAADNTFEGHNITATGIETLTIAVGGVGTAQTIGTIGGASTGLTATTTDLTVKFTGSNGLTVGAITADHIDASALTGAFSNDGDSFVATGTASSIKGGSKADTIDGDDDTATIIYGNGGNDTIVGGSGADTIYGGDGNDNINGDSGADKIYGGAGKDTITLADGLATIEGGAGDDTVVASTYSAYGVTVKGGEGTDILSVGEDESAAAFGIYSEFETLVLAAAGTAYDLRDFANNTFTTVAVGGVGATTITGAGSEVFCINDNMTGDFTITKVDATGSSDVVNIKIQTDASDNATDTTNEFVLTGFETINLESDDNLTTNGNLENTAQLNAANATTLTITGDSGLIIGAASGTALKALTTVNASGLVLDKVTDSGLTYTSTKDQVGASLTVTGSNGVDTITTNGVEANNIISAGDGADVLNYAGGTHSFTGGAGKDTFQFTTATAAHGSKTVHLTIADLTAGDKIDFTNVVDGNTLAEDTNGLGAAISLGSTSTLQNYMDQAASATTGATTGLIKWFQYSGDTYIVIDNSNDATFDTTTTVDALTKITGLVDLSNSTVGSSNDVLTIV